MFQKSALVSSVHPRFIGLSAIFFGVVLLFGCSQISIPLHPIPITLQTVGVILIILTYDTPKAAQTILAYIFLGALGFPMFAGYKGGIAVILGPSGGYILGFILATFVAAPCKKLLDSYHSLINAFVLSLIITLAIMATGLFWLSFHGGPTMAIKVGVMPFIIPGLIKSGILSLILRSIGYFKKQG